MKSWKAPNSQNRNLEHKFQNSGGFNHSPIPLQECWQASSEQHPALSCLQGPSSIPTLPNALPVCLFIAKAMPRGLIRLHVSGLIQDISDLLYTSLLPAPPPWSPFLQAGMLGWHLLPRPLIPRGSGVHSETSFTQRSVFTMHFLLLISAEGM